VFTKLKSLLYNNEVRAIVFQALAVVVIAYFAYQAFDNMMLNIEQRGIRSGFGFLNDEAGFAVNDNFFLEYSPASTNLQAFYVGIVNTLIVAITGIFFHQSSVLLLVLHAYRATTWLEKWPRCILRFLGIYRYCYKFYFGIQ